MKDWSEMSIEERLRLYAEKRCTPEHHREIKEYISHHPFVAVQLLKAMRDVSMRRLGLDLQTDPFIEDFGAASMRIENRNFFEIFSPNNVPNRQSVHIVDENRKNSKSNDMKTINFTPDQLKAFNDTALNLVNGIDSSKSTLSNMIAQLRAARPEMSVDEATMICRSLVAGVTNFTEVYEDLKARNATAEEMTNDVYNRCITAVADKTPKEQAAAMLNFIALAKYIDAANFSNAINGEAFESFESLLRNCGAIEGEVTPEMLEDIKAQLRDSISTSSIALMAEPQLKEIIASVDGSSDMTAELASRHMDDAAFKAYAALAAYMAASSGQLGELSAEIDPELLGVSVAAGIERERVLADAKHGLISWSTAVQCIKWIGGALLVGMFGWVLFKLIAFTVTAVTVATSMLLGVSYLSIFVGLLLGTFAGYKAGVWFKDHVAVPMLDGAGTIYDTVIESLSNFHPVEMVKNGFNKFVEFLGSIYTRLFSPVVSTVPVDVAQA